MLNKLNVLAGFVLFIMMGCASGKAFEYQSAKNMKIESHGMNQTRLSVDLVYFNPNKFAVTLKKVDCDVYVNQQLLGKIQLDTTMRIARKSSFTFPAKLVLDMKNVFSNALPFLFNKEVNVEVKGTARAGKSVFYKTYPFTYSGKHKLSLF